MGNLMKTDDEWAAEQDRQTVADLTERLGGLEEFRQFCEAFTVQAAYEDRGRLDRAVRSFLRHGRV